MTFSRRHCLATLGSALVLGASHAPAFADDWPSRPIRLIVKRGDRFVETYYSARWYNIFEIHDRDDGALT